MSLILRGWARAAEGEIDRGIAEINEGLKTERVKGALIYETYAYGLLADACIKHQRYEQALGFLRKALQILDQNNSAHFYAAEIYRLMGVARFRLSGNASQAEQWISQGLKLAREQKAKPVELKLYVTIRDLSVEGDAQTDFSSALRRLIESFKEGCDSSDLIKARAILEGPGADINRSRNRRPKSRKEILRHTHRSTLRHDSRRSASPSTKCEVPRPVR